MVSDEDVFATAAPASGIPVDGGGQVNAGVTQFQRTIATSTRTKAVTLNGDSTTANVVVTEDRSGTLAVRDFGSASREAPRAPSITITGNSSSTTPLQASDPARRETNSTTPPLAGNPRKPETVRANAHVHGIAA